MIWLIFNLTSEINREKRLFFRFLQNQWRHQDVKGIQNRQKI